LQHFFQTKIVANESGRHIFFIDLPLVALGVICLAWSKLDLVFIVLGALLLLDLAFCFAKYFKSDNITTNIDQDNVYQLSDQRNQERASRYIEVLNREVPAENQNKS